MRSGPRAFEALQSEHPDEPRLVHEVAGAYDTAGDQERAAPLYERALAAGLAGDVLRRCLEQRGSTLRNLGRYAAAAAGNAEHLLERDRAPWG
ncbi:tetratricopeptide repeat protein [Amnibacterium kyonggiense]|uniref:Tetratricopeptide repeat protein n=1 Tax=Amnibacterium kyonggiense TaxID=595671 RepID=A0A4R7FSE1_9MICO|nr:tetratricopeptide repeat protein [Amnibacterium kyonggiense]TDS80706.1 tetratricopeptide repeat protein [Amnibacterium kyonggiense]